MTEENQVDDDHFVGSHFESLTKILWALLIGVTWMGAILNTIINGAWLGILIMIPVSLLYYFVLVKKDAISRW